MDAASKPSASSNAVPRKREAGTHVDLTRPAVGGNSHDTDAASSAGNASDAPHAPHERDERAGMTGGAPSSAAVRQGAKDQARGLQDTSRGQESDSAYKRLKDS